MFLQSVTEIVKHPYSYPHPPYSMLTASLLVNSWSAVATMVFSGVTQH